MKFCYENEMLCVLLGLFECMSLKQLRKKIDKNFKNGVLKFSYYLFPWKLHPISKNISLYEIDTPSSSLVA